MNRWARLVPADDDIRTLLVVTSVLPFLVGFHFLLPEQTQNSLVFDHSEFAIHTLWTSAYVHLDDSHFYNNLIGYFVALLPTWLVFKSYHRERLFYLTLLLFFVAFPIVLSIASYGIYQFGLGADEAATRGFSGIVCAIFGLLFAAIIGLVRARAGWLAAFSGGASIAIIVMVLMLLQNGTLGVELLVLGFVGVLSGLMGVVYGGGTTDQSQLLTAIQENGLDIALVALGVFILLTGLPSLFPLDFVHEDKVTDIFTHAVGLFLGFITGMILTSWRT